MAAAMAGSLSEFLNALWSSSVLMWLLISLIGAALYYAYYMGVFQPLVFDRSGSVGPIVFLYKLHVGPYKNVGRVFDAMDAILEDRKIMPLCGVGLYFDNPNSTPAAQCRSYCGYSVNPKDLDAIGTSEWLSANGVLVKRIPNTRAVTCDFPYRNAWSFVLSVLRIYPAARAQQLMPGPADGSGCASVELYMPRAPLHKLTFAFPQENFEHFKIPAAAAAATETTDAAGSGGSRGGGDTKTASKAKNKKQ